MNISEELLIPSLQRLTRQLSGAPEGHPSRAPGSPAAERRGNQEFTAIFRKMFFFAHSTKHYDEA